MKDLLEEFKIKVGSLMKTVDGDLVPDDRKRESLLHHMTMAHDHLGMAMLHFDEHFHLPEDDEGWMTRRQHLLEDGHPAEN
jgi:hypothetical protein